MVESPCGWKSPHVISGTISVSCFYQNPLPPPPPLAFRDYHFMVGLPIGISSICLVNLLVLGDLSSSFEMWTFKNERLVNSPLSHIFLKEPILC